MSEAVSKKSKHVKNITDMSQHNKKLKRFVKKLLLIHSCFKRFAAMEIKKHLMWRLRPRKLYTESALLIKEA